ncbi:hypothetical protein N480_06095 [Pseudoalteromonas luteoviolacea S2607]|uniref:hypothetical protein n=1 Tax=Pseudoalteromonas luteoviolacea TaxID=43657 RepID=UPI0007B071A7|nr:hypothetical protein [Pseudoalteromonas luteoviolacea]KZN30526.1 hypothetical protein N480_06095 [Pseudoalteromonas luteoviolacea S2607]
MELKKTALRASVGFLLFSALFAMYVVLVGQFGQFEINVLLSTLSISIASMCAMACAAYIEKTTSKTIGSLGMGLSAFSLILMLLLIWDLLNHDSYWLLSWSSFVVAFAIAHALLLNLPPLSTNHMWLRLLANGSIALLAALVVFLIWQHDVASDAYFRVMVVDGIAIALVTLLIPIFSKLDHKTNTETQKTFDVAQSIHLTHLKDDIYIDEDGAQYKLQRLKTN